MGLLWGCQCTGLGEHGAAVENPKLSVSWENVFNSFTSFVTGAVRAAASADKASCPKNEFRECDKRGQQSHSNEENGILSES